MRGSVPHEATNLHERANFDRQMCAIYVRRRQPRFARFARGFARGFARPVIVNLSLTVLTNPKE